MCKCLSKYLIDANIFIESALRYYAFDICPGFWDWLKIVSIEKTHIKSVKKVLEEVKQPKELSEFLKELNKNKFFIDENKITPESFMAVASKLEQMNYESEPISEFSSGADFFLIALAYQDHYKIVTHEKRADNTRKRIKIPNVCQELGIECINVADLLRDEKIKFHYTHNNLFS
ncbi:DUF4411 family protein [Helicobacter sp. 11S02596-1]|uniref:DUF4411 family protein n=1 Tax=Helicobacter sp. 11S02596-1 TaxID=1476194 RepID=UPI000BA70A4E|nr:DUF4411 family protein [Helicobacter sp. 11S02596-1]PAF43528.1 hypothetical protein BJI48_04530 [Helicobacter sp. 11S02596-1]